MADQTVRHSGAGMGYVAILVALLFILGPSFLPGISGVSQIMLQGFGVLVLLVGSIIVIITRLYHKTSADEAFVRTGMGGARAIVDGGAIVIPVVHSIITVSLQTMKLMVERMGVDALITGDSLRADVKAEFFIKVSRDPQAVLDAGTSLGHKANNPGEVEKTVFEKLVNALRTVSATKTLAELHTQREAFASAVQLIVAADLRHNGLTLESVTISRLDQTPTAALRPADNVFDAQGARRIAEITNTAHVERVKIESDAATTVKEQEVARDQAIYGQEVMRAQAQASRDRDIRKAQAEAEQNAATFAAEQTKLAGIAKAEGEREVQVAEVNKAKAIEVANQQREQAARQAEVERQRGVALAERSMEIDVAVKETERAEAQIKNLIAQAEQEQKAQAILMIKVEAEAERKKTQAVVGEKAEAEREKVKQEMTADIQAYTTTKTAAAGLAAAKDDAEARKTLAEAEKASQILEAEGVKATQMVPVEVERASVEVEKQSLENQTANVQIAQELKVQLATIEATKAVRIELAKAMGVALSNTKMTIWGDPNALKQMTDAFINGQTWGGILEGFVNGNGDNGVAKEATQTTLNAISALVETLTGQKVIITTPPNQE